MRPATCHLLAAVDVTEPCPGDDCPFWDEACLLTELRNDLSTNAPLVHFLLGLRDNLEQEPRQYVYRGPGFD